MLLGTALFRLSVLNVLMSMCVLVGAGWTPVCLWASPVGHILDLILPTASVLFIRWIQSSSLSGFHNINRWLPPPPFLTPTPETALTSFCMAQGHKWSLLMLSEALSGVWTTAEPDPCTPQAVPTAGTPRLRWARPAVARSQPDLRSHHPTTVQTLGY